MKKTSIATPRAILWVILQMSSAAFAQTNTQANAQTNAQPASPSSSPRPVAARATVRATATPIPGSVPRPALVNPSNSLPPVTAPRASPRPVTGFQLPAQTARPVQRVTAPASNETAVDLGAPIASQRSTNAPSQPIQPASAPPSLASTINFKVYFDLDLYSRPGISNLTFDNFHDFLFFEASPLPGLQFSFDVNPNPRFYELDYQATPKMQLRAGKIWIPFDDTAFHNIYGGRVSVSRLSLGAAFLPDIWTDYGVGVKWETVDRKNIHIVTDLYVVNGFKSGTGDPVGNATSPYPVFSDTSITPPDNNADKAIGGRVHGLFWNRLGAGFSFYTERWSDQSQPSYRLLILGGDLQYRIPSTQSEFRFGIASMKINAPSGAYYRGGSYLEYGQFVTKNRMWKILIRGGTLVTDDRVVDPSDVRLVGATLLWRPNTVIEISLEHTSDLQNVATKTNYSYTNLRTVIAF